ncbi:MAG: TonB-dependent receptor [Saprospiraceae bacterium]
MRTQIINLVLAIAAFTFMGQNLWAQPGGDLPSEKVEVIKIFEAKLAESEKVNLSPQLPPVDTSVSHQFYEVPPKEFYVDYPAPRIRPISYKTGEEVPDVYKAYAKLGGGLPASIFAEGAFNTVVKRSDKSSYDVGLNILHHSADFSNNDIENQKFGLTKAEGKGTYYFEQGFAVGTNLGYTSNKVHYYGYSLDPFNTETDVPADAVKQLFNTFDFGIRIFNGVRTAGDVNYNAGLDFYRHTDNFASGETGLNFDLKGTKWIAERHSFDLNLSTDFTWYNDTMAVGQTLHNYTLAPAFTYHGSAFKLKGGGKLISNNDEFFLFPDLELVLNLTGNELALFAGVTGGLQKNTFRSLSGYNPYIHTRLPDNTLRNTKYFKGYAGVRGNLKLFEYTAEASFKPANDVALYKFRFDNDLIYDFDVVYDDIDIINISGSIKAIPIKGLELTGTVSQNIYDTKLEDKAWHLPSLEVNFKALYISNDGKLRANAQVFLENGVPANIDPVPGKYKNLNSLFDLSLGAEYWFVKNFAAFIDVNNLLGNERQRWYYYPTYGTNVLGGITMRF